jgi:outer membrane protein assembly factor BamA
MVGTQFAVASAELRFPIQTPQFGILPQGFPPLEGAIFYDIGLSWNENSTLRWNRQPTDHPTQVRTPSRTVGLSLRSNLIGFALAHVDVAFPLDRRGVGALWTFSLGPAF